MFRVQCLAPLAVLLISLPVMAQTPSTNSVTFQYSQGNPAPTGQTVTIINGTNVSARISQNVDQNGNPVTSGSDNAGVFVQNVVGNQVNIGLNSGILATLAARGANIYSGTLMVSATNCNSCISVTMTLQIGTGGQITITQNGAPIPVGGVTMSAAPGGVATTILTLSSISQTSFGVASSQPWLSAAPSTGNAGGGAGAVNITLTANAGAPGVQTGTNVANLAITTGLGSANIQVNFVVGGANTLTLMPASMSFNYATNTQTYTPFQTQALLVSGVASGTVLTAASNANWLLINGGTSFFGLAPQVLNITANATALGNPPASGTYTGQVTVSAGSQFGTLNATLTVNGSGSGTLSFNVATPGGPAPPAQMIAINGTGTFTAIPSTSNGNTTWLSVSPSFGTVNGSGALSVSVNPAGLGTGSYNGQVQIFLNGTALTTTAVNLTVGGSKVPLTVWRPVTGMWYVNPLNGPATVVQWGLPSDDPIAGDFNGDGVLDYVVWRPTNGTWYVMLTSNPGAPMTFSWGLPGDHPLNGDFDGDRVTDYAVWRPLNGTWYIVPSSNPGSPIIRQWGLPSDIPVIGDFDGDRKTDFAVWRPVEGNWYVAFSNGGSIVRQWGLPGDIPVPADYDGDGRTDFAVWRPFTGTWYIIPSSNPAAPYTVQWGLPGDIPVARDYDGDGKADPAVWRPVNGTWYINLSTTPGTPEIVQWGLLGDVAIYRPTGF